METLRFDSRWPSGLALVLANLVPVYGVLAWGWSPHPLLMLYWLETVVVGAIALLRMLFAHPAEPGYWILKLVALPLLPLFLVPFAMLVAIMGSLVFGVFASDSVRHAFVSVLFAASGGSELLPLDQALRVFRSEFDDGIAMGAAVLAGSHLVSFFWNYLARGECHRVGLGSLVIQPIARVWLVSIAVIVGMFGALKLDAPVWMLVLLIGLKTGLDLYAHLSEHRAAPQPALIMPPP